MIFTGEGPNTCVCLAELPGTSHWSNDALPFTTCPDCGLHYVLEDGEVACYSGEALDLAAVAL